MKWVEEDKAVRKRVSGRRLPTLSAHRGTYFRARLPREKATDIALDATIRAACQATRGVMATGCRLRINKEDLREKLRIGKISTPTVFVVDASGSMFTQERMESAKGAVFSMLMDAYQKRDKVGLVAFREHQGEVILPLCSSLDYAIKCLRNLASGGPTPLSAGLQKGLEMLLREKRKNPDSLPLLVLISDGRANVPLAADSDIEEELRQLTEVSWKNKLHTIFIDVEPRGATNQRHGNYKQVLQDRMSYYHVEQLTAEALENIVVREKMFLTSWVD